MPHFKRRLVFVGHLRLAQSSNHTHEKKLDAAAKKTDLRACKHRLENDILDDYRKVVQHKGQEGENARSPLDTVLLDPLRSLEKTNALQVKSHGPIRNFTKGRRVIGPYRAFVWFVRPDFRSICFLGDLSESSGMVHRVLRQN